MPIVLQEEDFCEALLPEVIGFYCGDNPWELAIAQWIKAPRSRTGALKSMRKRGTQVWLFWHPDGRLVGYGSLGTTDWTWPPPEGPVRRVSIIPCLGIQTVFRRQPDGPKNERFSHQIMEFLLSTALSLGVEDIVLQVEQENVGALTLYRHFHFEAFPIQDGTRIKMHRPLR